MDMKDLPPFALEELPSSKPKDAILRFVSARHAKRARLGALPPELRVLLPFMVTTHDRAFAYLKNSKAGCTTISNLLYLHDHGIVFEGDIHSEPKKLQYGLAHWEENLALFRSPDSVAFSFVRHPQHRLVSAFVDFFVERRNFMASRHFEAIDRMGFTQRDDLSYRFDVFLNYVKSSMEYSPVLVDRHWRSQHVNLGNGYLELDYVGKLEQLEAEISIISEMAGTPLPQLHMVSEERRNSSSSQKFTPSDKQRRMIEDIYSKDYALFGY